MTPELLPWTAGWMVVPFIKIGNTGEEGILEKENIYLIFDLLYKVPVRNPSGDALKAVGYTDFKLRIKVMASDRNVHIVLEINNMSF